MMSVVVWIVAGLQEALFWLVNLGMIPPQS